MRLLLGTLAALAAGEPNDHFVVDLQEGQVRDLAGYGNPLAGPPVALRGSASRRG
jgi:hypothetical protein